MINFTIKFFCQDVCNILNVNYIKSTIYFKMANAQFITNTLIVTNFTAQNLYLNQKLNTNFTELIKAKSTRVEQNTA